MCLFYSFFVERIVTSLLHTNPRHHDWGLRSWNYTGAWELVRTAAPLDI